MLERIATWWKTGTAIQALEHLDDRMLADMGLERDEIRPRVRGEAERAAGGSPGPALSEARC